MSSNDTYSYKYKTYQCYAAYTAFSIMIFISFFGTSAPFPDRAKSVEDIGTSNIFNQIIYLLIFFLSIYAIYNRKKDLVEFILNEKYLSLLIIWYFLGMIWSVDSFSTFKLSFRLLTVVLSSLAYFLHYPWYDSSDNILKFIAALFVIINVILVFTVSGALDPDFHTWRGIVITKNIFGQVAALTFVVYIDILIREGNKYWKFFLTIIAFISIILLFGSQSSTSIISFIAFIFLLSILYTDRIFKSIHIGRFFSTILQIVIITTIIFIIHFYPAIIEDFVSGFGKDTTFTGRTDLWYYAMLSIEKNFPLGTGLGAYWNTANNDLSLIHYIFPWIPMQFHNGFIDIFNEAGIIGFSFFICLCMKYLRNSWALRVGSIWFYFIIVVFIFSFQESTLSSPGHLINTLFYMGYVRIIVISNKLNK